MTTATFPMEDVLVDRAERIAVRPRRDGRRGTTVGPVARPRPGLRLAPAPAARSAKACRADARVLPTQRATVASSTWRLTDRGVAVILVAAAMIAVAAAAVIGLTALRVTSDGYVPSGVSQLAK